MRTTGARWGTSAMGRSAYLLTHGTLRGGTSDAVAFELQQNHLLASYNNQQKTALGGLVGAQALRRLSNAPMALPCRCLYQ